MVALAALGVLAPPASALATSPAPGSFTGNIPGRTAGLTFYVSADSTHVQDVSIPTDDLTCTGEGSPAMNDHLEAFEVQIEAGTFTTTQTEEGRLEGHQVTFTFNFSGAFATSGEEASGTYSEEIVFSGSTRVCKTGTQSFAAKRDAQATQTTEAPPAGSYRANIPGRTGGLTFYVSGDSTHLQDVSIPTDDLKCTGEGTTPNDVLEAFEVPLTATTGNNASFVYSGTEKGTLEGKPVSIVFIFNGHFHSVNKDGVERAAGTYREDITFEGGSTRRCTTNNEWFSALRETQGAQTTEAPPAGSYRANIPGSNPALERTGGLTFYVSADSTHLQDVSIPTDDLKCTGEGSTPNDELEAFEVPLTTTAGNNASFVYSATEKGTLEGKPVTIKFTFNGHFHSVNTETVERAAGTYREDITFEGGSTRRCTTNNQWFSALREAQGAQTTEAPPAGSYTANIPGAAPGNERTSGLTFYVLGAHVQDVYIPTDDLKCTGEGAETMNDHLEVFEVPVKLTAIGRTFKVVKTEKGAILEGKPVTIKFTFNGHFHSVNTETVERAAGTYREDITFEGGSTRRCTTNNQWFSALRETQPAQTTAPPPAGNYIGNIPGRTAGLSFEVSSNSLDVTNVKIPTDDLKCTGEGASTGNDKLEITSLIAIKSKVSFKVLVTGTGTVGGKPVSFTYSFAGHFHSVNGAGKERAAGTYEEELVFEGSTRRCTTDTQSFSAAHV